MKKIISLVIAALILSTSFACFAAAETIILNGTEAVIPADMGKIMEKDDRTFVPLRFVMENLGCQVSYDDEVKAAYITQNENLYVFQVDNNLLFVLNSLTGEKKSIEMDTTVFLNTEEGRMYIPIRFLAEAIGYEVGWEEATQTVTLSIAK